MGAAPRTGYPTANKNNPRACDVSGPEDETDDKVTNNHIHKMSRAVNKNKAKRTECRGAILDTGIRQGLPSEMTLEQRPVGRRDKPRKYLGGEHARRRAQPVQRACGRRMRGGGALPRGSRAASMTGKGSRACREVLPTSGALSH